MLKWKQVSDLLALLRKGPTDAATPRHRIIELRLAGEVIFVIIAHSFHSIILVSCLTAHRVFTPSVATRLK